MICYNCGNEVTTEGTNCPFCGAILSPTGGNTAEYNQQAANQQTQGAQNQGYYSQGAPNQGYYNQGQQQGYWGGNQQSSQLKPETAAIICYITWIGLLIAFIASDKNDPFLKHHLNNALIIVIASVVFSICAAVPVIGWLVAVAGEIFIVVCFFMGLIGAINKQYTELPLIGNIKIIK